MPEDGRIARRNRPPGSDAQIDGCGRCHARRGTLGDYHYGADLLDTHRLTMPRPPAYHVDGQIRDEVYVYGSFVQSRMHLAGVVCSNCHEPHSLQLRAPGNGVCTQCHAPSHYDSEQHHHHAAQSAGAQCAACHMPETTYMQVDPRRDHSMRIPRPDLSQVIGTPNACTQCHADQKADWAARALREWGISFDDTARHPARALHRLEQGDNRAVPRLAQLAGDTGAAPIWRATAMEALGEVGGREAMQAATSMLYHDDPLLRASSVRALQFLSPAQRFQLLQALVDDPVTTVRMEVALALAGVPLAQVQPEQAARLKALFEEYLAIQRRHADMPGALLQTGYFHAARGEPAAAEKAYREAIRLNRQLIPAYINLADLLRSESRDGEARELLLKALDIAPEHGPTLHVLGLLETRSGNPEAALDYLGRAAGVESSGIRHRFVYAIALHDLGKPQEAIAQLRSLLRTVPQNEDVLLALANYHAELGRREAAAGYARTLTQVAPGNRAYRALYERLSAGGR
ncbi:MAG: tetratricopeptide repeat protein [Halioglobus sp.]|nr:tetratricopeptide repeat protein [Halioglobus sp.]